MVSYASRLCKLSKVIIIMIGNMVIWNCITIIVLLILMLGMIVITLKTVCDILSIMVAITLHIVHF